MTDQIAKEENGKRDNFPYITKTAKVSHIPQFAIMFIVQIEEEIEIWYTSDRIRGMHNLIDYYQNIVGHDLDSSDFITAMQM